MRNNYAFNRTEIKCDGNELVVGARGFHLKSWFLTNPVYIRALQRKARRMDPPKAVEGERQLLDTLQEVAVRQLNGVFVTPLYLRLASS